MHFWQMIRFEHTIRIVQIGALRQRLYIVKTLLHQLRRLLEDNLFVRLGHQPFFAILCRCYFTFNYRRLKQLQYVVQRDRSLGWIVEVQLYDHLKFSPSCFRHLVRRFGDNSIRVGVAFVQLEMYLLHIGRHVFVVIRFDVDIPLMCVAILFPFFAEGTRHIAVDYWFDHGESLMPNKKRIKSLLVMFVPFHLRVIALP